MPLYYFDCIQDGAIHSDDVGAELASDEVEDEARAILLKLIGESIHDRGAFRISVVARNADGSTAHAVQACVSGSVGGMPS